MTDQTDQPTEEHNLAELEAAGEAEELGADPDVDRLTPAVDPYYQPGDEDLSDDE